MSGFDPQFGEIDTSRRTPSDQFEFNDSTALGLPGTRKRVLLLAPTTSAGAAANAELVEGLADEDAVGDAFGVIAKRMANIIFRIHPTCWLDGLAVDEASGAAATATILFATTAAADGTIEIWLGRQWVPVAITSGMTAAQIATAVQAAIAAAADCAWTATVDTATVTLTYKFKGLMGNGERVVALVPPALTTTATVTHNADGATDPTFSSTYTDVYKDINYDVVICPWKFASGSLTALKNAATYMRHAARGNGASHFIGVQDTYANALTYQGTVEHVEFTLLWRKPSVFLMPPHEVAAYEAAVYAAESDPSVPFIRELRDLDPYVRDAVAGAPPTAAEIENCLNHGLSPYALDRDASGTRLVQLVTAATKLSGGATSQAWASIHVRTVAKYVRKAAALRLETVYSTRASRKMTDGKPGDVRGHLLALLFELASQPLEYLSKAELEQVKDKVVVRVNATNTEFLDLGFPMPIIRDYRGANTMLFLTIPRPQAA